MRLYQSRIASQEYREMIKRLQHLMIEKDVPNAVLTQKANISDNIISKIKKWSVYGIGKA